MEEQVNVLDSSPSTANPTTPRILTMDEYILQKASTTLPPSTAARLTRIHHLLANPLLLMNMAESSGQTLGHVRWRLGRLLDPNVDDSGEAEDREWNYIMSNRPPL